MGIGRHAAACNMTVGRSLQARDGRKLRLAKAGRRLHQRIQNRLQVESRATDDFKNVRGRRLLLEGFTKLVEQSRVFDSNNRLGGKVFYQFNLLVRKRSHLLAVDSDGTNQVVLLEH